MGQKIASLEIELGMTTGGATAEINRFGGVVDKVTAQAVRDLDRIDTAMQGVGNTSAAEAGMVRIAEASARSAIATAREMNRIERAGEGVVAQLDRQIAAYGLTAAQVRSLKAEEAALAADRAGKAELAARIREREAHLYDLEYAAMRRAKAEAEALAEEKAAAAVAAERSAAQMRAEAAAAEQAAVEHARLAAAVRASHDAQEADALAAERLRAATDPLYAAVKRLNDEIAESTRLYHAGATAPAEYARQQEVLAARLRAVGQSSDDVIRKNARISSSLTQLSFQGNDIVTMYMAGASAGQIFATQAGQIVQVVQMAEGGFWGLARAVAAALIPFAPLIIVAGLAAGGLMLLNKQMNEDSGLKEYAASLGLTHKEMKKLGDVSVTAGDMIKGLWKTIGDSTAIGDFFSDVWSFIKGFTANFWDTILGLTGGLYTVAMGTYRGFVATWEELPAAFADIFIRSVNAAIEKLNGLGEATNKLLGVDLFGQIAPLENAYAGAADKVSDAWSKAFSDSRKEWNDGLKQFSDDWTKNSQQAARDRLDAKAKEIIADRTPKTNSHADQLAREAAAVEAQIKNLYALADAYRISGAEALIAEARVKAESQAIKARGEVEAYVDRQVRLAIAQRVSDAAKSTAAMRDQARIQEQVNAQVAAGLVPAAAAAQLVRDQLADLPLLQAAEAARMRGNAADAATATKALEEQRAARQRLADAEQAARVADMAAANDNELERLALETRLIGANTVERVRQLATLKAWQDAVAKNMNVDEALAYVDAEVRIAEAQDKLAAGQERFNDLLSGSEDAVKRYADALGASFGSVGESIAGVTRALIDHGAVQRQLDEERKNSIARAGKDAAMLAKAEQDYARASADNQIGAYADITGAAKGMFSERSKIYKALETAETVFRAVQLAMSIQAMVQNAAETAATVANAGVRATAEGTAGVAAQSKLPFPFNIAAMAATAAALVGFGVAMLSGGGGSRPQTNEGAGTVFGDTTAKSDSIKRSIDLLGDLEGEMLVFTRQMAASLKAIESNIGGLTNLVIRLGGADGIGANAAAGVNTGFKSSTGGLINGATLGAGLGVAGALSATAGLSMLGIAAGPLGVILAGAIGAALSKVPIIGDILGGIGKIVSGLFGTKTKVVGSGIYGEAQTLGDIESLGFDGQTFADIQKKKKFLGVTTSTKYSTQYGDLDAALEDQFGKLLLSFADTIKLAAGPLGLSLDDVEAKLNSFVVDIGKIDLKDLSGEEIQEKLTAVFGAQADKMAQFVLGGLEKFQEVGEGYFETLVRVAASVETVTTSLQQLGLSAQSLGVDASMAIVKLFGGANEYASAAGAYFDAFYTDAEQAAARAAQLGKVFDSLGVTMPDSISAYRALVEAQDLTTAAGQQLYAQLLQLGPAFAEIISAGQSAASAAAIMRERQDLEKQLLEMQGDTVALRQRELAELDPSNRALQLQIWAMQDHQKALQEQEKAAQEAAAAAKQLADAWHSAGDALMAEVARIRGGTVAGAGSYQSLIAQFNSATDAARRGDIDAAKSLPGLSRSLLDAAADQVGTRAELALIQGQTAGSLEATYRLTEQFADQQDTAITVAQQTLTAANDQTDWLATLADLQASQADDQQAANDALLAEIQGLREQVVGLADDQRTGHAAIVSTGNRTAKVLENASDGDRLRVEEAA